MFSIFRQKQFLAILFIILSAIFLYITFQVYNGASFNFDERVFLLTHRSQSDFVTDFAVACTFLGSQTFLLPANIILGAFFLFKNKLRAYVWKIAAVSLTSTGFLFLIKYIVKRERPETPLLDAALHYSFPSGHTFTSITFFGMLLYFAFKYFESLSARILLVLLCLAVVVSIGWSRIYLHVHYASDVIAGFCLGVMWLILAEWLLIERKKAIQQ